MINDITAENIYQLLAETTERYPDNTAITYIEEVAPELRDTSYSFSEFLKMMNQTARLIHRELDGQRGTIAFLLPNLPQGQALLWGGSAVAIGEPLNPLLDEESLVNLLDIADAQILFALGPQSQPGIWEKALAVAKKSKTLKKVYSVLTPAPDSDHPHYDTEVVKECSAALPEKWLPKSDDIATYFHTGGTTGTPKLAMHSHRNQVVAATTLNKYSGFNAGETAINGLPLFHLGGTTMNVLSVLICGMSVILPTIAGYRNKAVIENFWKLVEHYRIVNNLCIPTSMSAILQVPVGDADISSLNRSACGGAAVPDSVADSVLEVTGHPLYQGYGSTETTSCCALPVRHVELIKGCAGWVPPEVEIRIGDGNCASGEAGEIFVRGETVFKGYVKQTESAIDAEGWYATGDLAYLNENGRLFISGRCKDLIIRGGHNIDPAAIEVCLEKHPAVNLAAAVAKPDSYAGELPIAYVQLYPGQTATPEELQAFATKHIHERPACPKQIFILDALPLTAMGKIHKPTLREAAVKLMVQESLAEAAQA
jgi:fatty-acyl-CoA synthase